MPLQLFHAVQTSKTVAYIDDSWSHALLNTHRASTYVCTAEATPNDP